MSYHPKDLPPKADLFSYNSTLLSILFLLCHSDLPMACQTFIITFIFTVVDCLQDMLVHVISALLQKL